MYAEDSFQLLEARTANLRVEMPWRRERPYMNPHAVFSRTNFSRLPNQQEDITAIIGKNGTGKSHLLGAIVRTFIALEEYQLRKRSKLSALPLEYLVYMADGKHCVVEQNQLHQTIATVDNLRTDIASEARRSNSGALRKHPALSLSMRLTLARSSSRYSRANVQQTK